MCILNIYYTHQEVAMAKVRKQFILDSTKIARARKALGVSTDTEAVSTAIDLLLANAEIIDLHKKFAGRLKIKNMDQSNFNG